MPVPVTQIRIRPKDLAKTVDSHPLLNSDIFVVDSDDREFPQTFSHSEFVELLKTYLLHAGPPQYPNEIDLKVYDPITNKKKYKTFPTSTTIVPATSTTGTKVKVRFVSIEANIESLGSEIGFTSDTIPSIKEMGSEIGFISNEIPSIKELGVEIGFTSS